MISKLKENTILLYCMASLIVLLLILSQVIKPKTESKNNSKRMVTSDNYMEAKAYSYGFLAQSALSCIMNTEDDTQDRVLNDQESFTISNEKCTLMNASLNSNIKVERETSEISETPLPSNIALGQKIIKYAKKFVGNPYRRGGTSLTKGIDCSGFTMRIFEHFGISLPRSSSAQASIGVEVSFDALEPGDLVFYNYGKGKITHVAIYMGDGKIIHARTPEEGIGINSVNIMHKVTARRVIK